MEGYYMAKELNELANKNGWLRNTHRGFCTVTFICDITIHLVGLKPIIKSDGVGGIVKSEQIMAWLMELIEFKYSDKIAGEFTIDFLMDSNTGKIERRILKGTKIK